MNLWEMVEQKGIQLNLDLNRDQLNLRSLEMHHLAQGSSWHQVERCTIAGTPVGSSVALPGSALRWAALFARGIGSVGSGPSDRGMLPCGSQVPKAASSSLQATSLCRAVVCTWSEAYEGGFATFSKGDLRRQIHQDYIMESFAIGYFVY